MKRPALAVIRFYQQRISPGMAPACRFQPTCSVYAYDAIDAYGAVRGIAMAAWRILRCNPLNDGGFEPVPEHTPTRATQTPLSISDGEGPGVRPRA